MTANLFSRRHNLLLTTPQTSSGARTHSSLYHRKSPAAVADGMDQGYEKAKAKFVKRILFSRAITKTPGNRHEYSTSTGDFERQKLLEMNRRQKLLEMNRRT